MMKKIKMKKNVSPDILDKIFRKMCLCRHFEQETMEAVRENQIPGPVYLSIGQEAAPASISLLTAGYSIFTQHRGHSVYISHGGKLEPLIDELLGKETGCCRGTGGSPCIQDLDIPMFGHHGLIGENIPIATGYAFGTRKPTIAYFGDAAAEEDYALSSFGFAATHKLPILFVCEDNDLSILTPIKDRRSWDVHEVAKAMNLTVYDIDDHPATVYNCVQELLNKLPAFINIHTCRHRWHAGIGIDGPPKSDRLEELRPMISGHEDIEKDIELKVKRLWEKQLQKQ